MSASGSAATANAVTATARGPLINVATWITVSAMVITVISKLFIKWSVVRRFQLDDFLITFAAVCAIGQSVATSEEVANGLGQHEPTLSQGQVEGVLKAAYASAFLYLTAVFMTKIANLAFFVILMGPLAGRSVRVIQLSAIFCVLWTFVGYFVLGFQCQLPTPWDYGTGHCLNKPAYWTATAVVDIFTQIIVSFMPAYLLRDLQASTGKRLFSMLAFTPNLLTIALVVLRLVFLYRVNGATDRTWDWFSVVLTTTIHAQLSVLFGALPYLKPLIDSMVVLPAMIPTETMTTIGGPDDSFGSSLKISTARWTRSLSVFTEQSGQKPIQRNETVIEAVHPTPRALPAVDDEQGSEDRMRILRTQEFAVTS